LHYFFQCYMPSICIKPLAPWPRFSPKIGAFNPNFFTQSRRIHPKLSPIIGGSSPFSFLISPLASPLLPKIVTQIRKLQPQLFPHSPLFDPVSFILKPCSSRASLFPPLTRPTYFASCILTPFLNPRVPQSRINPILSGRTQAERRNALRAVTILRPQLRL
jgi:hypothetical protein